MAVYVAHYPPTWPASPALSRPDPAKITSASRSFLALLVLNLAAWTASRPLRALWRVDSQVLAVVLRLTIGLFVLAHLVLALGLAGWLSPRSLGLITAALALAGIPSCLRTVRSRPDWPRWSLRRVPAVTWLIAGGLVLSSASAYVPAYGWDALVYHLALPEQFLRRGHLVFDPYSHFTTFPLLNEMLYTLALALDGPALTKLLCVEMGALLLAALASTAGRFGRAAALFATVCVLCDPLFLWETTVVYTDLGLALLALLATEAVMSWEEQPTRGAALRAAALAGLCAAVRYPGGFVPLALAVAVLAGGRQPWRRRLAMCGGLGVAALAFASPWLLRNLANTGSATGLSAFDPVFLQQMLAFHHERIGMGRGLVDLLAAAWNVTFHTVPGVYTESFGYQVGPLYLVAGVLAIAAGWRSAERAFLLRVATVQLLAWFYTEQESRFLLPSFVLVALAGAIGFARVSAAGTPRSRAALALAPAGALLLGQIWLWNDCGPLYRMAFGDISWDSVARATPAEELGASLRALRRPDLKVLCLFESRSWHLRGVASIPYHLNEGSPAMLALHRALDSGSFCHWLSEQRVTHLIVNSVMPRVAPPVFVDGYTREDWQRDLDRLNRFLGSSADLRANVHGTLLFELRSGASCRDPESDAPTGR